MKHPPHSVAQDRLSGYSLAHPVSER